MGLLTDPKNREKAVKFIASHNNKLCVLCYIGGVAWFLALAYRPLNAGTYFSENALLPGEQMFQFPVVDLKWIEKLGLVEADFFHDHGASQIYSSLKDELRSLKDIGGDNQYRIPINWLENQLRSVGLDTYVQNFSFSYPVSILKGEKFSGTNVYGILRSPRCASTEAIVLSAPYRPPDGDTDKTNHGIALLISLAKAFRRHTYWAKDIIFLFTEHEQLGMQAWLEAYHDIKSPHIGGAELFGRSGAIQAALNIEIGHEKLSKMNIMLEGLNGQLPNLDLFNTVVKLCRREGIPPAIHKRLDYWNQMSVEGWQHSLVTMVTMMWHQAPGSPSANHGLFHRYNIEAVTLNSLKAKSAKRTFGYVEVGRVLEGIVRSLNNLLERFHQSFFFYLLPSTERYVSIGLYMPPFGLLAAPILIKALALWIAFCFEWPSPDGDKTDDKDKENTKKEDSGESKGQEDQESEAAEKKKKETQPRGFFSITPTLIMSMFFGLISYSGAEYAIVTSNAFHMEPGEGLMWGALALTLSAALFPKMMQRKTKQKASLTGPNPTLLKCVGLLTLGVVLAMTALINISLAVFITVIWVPVMLVASPVESRLGRLVLKLLVLVVSPFGLAVIGSIGHQIISNGNKLPAMVKLWPGTLQSLQQALLMGVIESHMIGNWTLALITLAFVPTWTILWAVLW